MKTIFLLFDSLNLRYLQPYGNANVHCPNFERLAEHSITFDRCYTGSLPCMPARRDFHTGRISFLHRSWGPLEPYDDSFVQMLRKHNVYTHLISDHMHYWEEGGATYHTKYDSWEVIRGQEGDGWVPAIDSCDMSSLLGRKDSARFHDIANRKRMQKTGKYPLDKISESTMRFLDDNHDKDNWFLHVESFDPHEPFFSHAEFQEKYPDSYVGPEFDWPSYKKVTEPPEQVEHCRNRYAALVSACDAFLGEILDQMDRYHMWEDTALVVTTDHGYLLGEHGWWAKSKQPVYNEIAHVPLFYWDPMSRQAGKRTEQLCQICDLAPTFLDRYNISKPKEMTGVALDLSLDSESTRSKEVCIFGMHGCHLNITDGRYVYMRHPRGKELFNYTLMPSDMKSSFPLEELQNLQLHPGFSFTKGCPVLRVPANPWADIDYNEYGDMLFDLKEDPQQMNPINNSEIAQHMCRLLSLELKRNDAPEEAYAYWDLKKV